MVTCYMICHNINDDYYHKGREGGGQRVMVKIIISENYDNDGWPLGVSPVAICFDKKCGDKMGRRYEFNGCKNA